jgi:hypothetical protein
MEHQVEITVDGRRALRLKPFVEGSCLPMRIGDPPPQPPAGQRYCGDPRAARARAAGYDRARQIVLLRELCLLNVRGDYCNKRVVPRHLDL